jgi:hypothetical protein
MLLQLYSPHQYPIVVRPPPGTIVTCAPVNPCRIPLAIALENPRDGHGRAVWRVTVATTRVVRMTSDKFAF